MKKEYITYMTHLKSDNPMDYDFLSDCMNVMLHYTTKRFVDLRKKNQLGSYDKKQCDNYLKTQTFVENDKIKTILDARYSRAIDISIHAKCASLLECKQAELEAKLLKQEILFNKFIKAKAYYQNTKNNKLPNLNQAYKRLNHANNKLVKITSKIEKLTYQIKHKSFNGIVFGGKTLFKKQHKDGIDFALWKKAWSNRADEFECGGSLSENYGNKQFQLTISKKEKDKTYFNLKINVPYILREKYGSSYILKDIYFPRGQKQLEENVLKHEQYLYANNAYEKLKAYNKKNKIITNPSLKPSAKDIGCQSVSFLIKKKANGEIYIHASMPRLKKDITTHDRNGVIAIDINYKNISIAEINQVGKLLYSKVFKFNFGKNYSADYREQLINKHINTIVEYAKVKNKSIVIESLDFFKKKAKQLKDLDKNYNRMLHTLAYAKIAERIRLACYQEGVGFSKVNAAYSSMLGKTLYSKEYGISVHQAAAYVLARRYYKLEEYYHVQKINFIFKDKACSLTIPEDIFKKQDKIKPTKFHSLLYYWLAKELKAPSRFYKRETLTSQVVQPTYSHEILEING